MYEYLQAKSINRRLLFSPEITAATPDTHEGVLCMSLSPSVVVVTMQGCKDNWQNGSHQNSTQLHQGQALSVAYDLWQDVYA